MQVYTCTECEVRPFADLCQLDAPATAAFYGMGSLLYQPSRAVLGTVRLVRLRVSPVLASYDGPALPTQPAFSLVPRTHHIMVS